ncbi:hypothetical protein Tco_1539469 [Tanacetum coccineum]
MFSSSTSNNPLIVKNWHPDVNLLKEDVGDVPVWVKLCDVPVTVFIKDGLSAIVTKLGTALMLDSYTSHMCMQSWGRSSYARAMIELRADVELKDNIVVAMPKITREGFYTCKIRVEYEWKPLRKDGYSTNSLLGKWKESYENNDYDYNPYVHDMYEGLKLQSICDNLDIKVRGRKKK